MDQTVLLKNIPSYGRVTFQQGNTNMKPEQELA